MYVQVFHLFYELISIYVVICIMKFYFYIPVCSINSVYNQLKQNVSLYKTICTKYNSTSKLKCLVVAIYSFLLFGCERKQN